MNSAVDVYRKIGKVIMRPFKSEQTDHIPHMLAKSMRHSVPSVVDREVLLADGFAAADLIGDRAATLIPQSLMMAVRSSSPPVAKVSMNEFVIPLLGPLVGHTTSKGSKIWLRANAPQGNIPMFGVIVSPSENRVEVIPLEGSTRYGVFMYEVKTPSKIYVSTIGRADAVDVFKDATTRKLVLDNCTSSKAFFAAKVTPFPSGPTDEITFLMGSCRFPYLGDPSKVFGHINSALEGNLPALKTFIQTIPQLMLHVGDQIYGDRLGAHVPLYRAESDNDFEELYVEAFGAADDRKALSLIPHYFTWDDHEIEDNWTQMRLKDPANLFSRGYVNSRAGKDKFVSARNQYIIHQLLHSPVNDVILKEILQDPYRDLNATPPYKDLHYSFDCGGFSFFVFDSRSNRNVNNDGRMFSKQQMIDFNNWLEKRPAPKDKPRFVVTSTVLLPITKAGAGSDDFEDFLETRRDIIDAIAANSCTNVIFLSGDIHSYVSAQYTIETKNGQTLSGYAITTSPLHWVSKSFATANESQYYLSTRANMPGKKRALLDSNHGQLDYHVLTGSFVRDAHFGAIQVRGNALRVAIVGTEGQLLQAVTCPLQPWK